MLNAEVPLYHQIYLHMRAEIADGQWVGREDFPGEIELAHRFGVSVITSRKALNRLAEDGYIDRGRGRRTRVISRLAPASSGSPPEIIQTSPGAPRSFTYKVLSHGIDVAPAEACAAFELPAGTRLWICSRLRSYQGRPHSVTLNVQRPEIGKEHALRQLQREPMTHILREKGISFSRLSRRINAVLAPPHVAVPLGLTLNDPTLVYTFTHHDAQDQVVQWVRIWVRSNEPGVTEEFNYATGAWSMSSVM